jgi:hypothetical protein
MVGGAFQGMVAPSSITGQIEAKVRLETSSLDAFILQLLEGLQRMESVSCCSSSAAQGVGLDYYFGRKWRPLREKMKNYGSSS